MDDTLLYIELLKKVYDKILADLPPIIAECRGPRGFAGEHGRDGSDGKDFVFTDHADSIRQFIQDGLPKFSDFTTEQIELIRGPQGMAGKDFIFSDSESEISKLLYSHIQSISDSLKLKFSDLTDLEKDTLRGPRGSAGRDFNFSDHQSEIQSLITDYIQSISDSLRFTFQNFTAEQLESLRGPAGKDGKDFDLEAHKEFIRQLPININDLTSEQRDSLRLKFSDLTEHDISMLRGPRGQRGKNGEQGLQGIPGVAGVDGKNGEQGLQGIPGVAGERGEPGINGKDGDPGPQGRMGIPGVAGERGEPGINGKDGDPGPQGDTGERGPRGQRGTPGSNGVSPPSIKSVKTINGLGGFRMVFHFSDSTKVVSDFVKFNSTEKAPAAPESRDLLHGVVCGAESFVGAAVRLQRINGVNAAVLSKADSEENSNFFGFIHSISDNYCTIVHGGIAENIFADLNPIKTYYLSDTFAGVIMPFPPENSGSVRLRIGQPSSENSLLIRVGEREIVA